MRIFVYVSMHMGMSLAVPTPGPSLIHLLRGSTLMICCQFHSFFIAMFASIISMCTMSGILHSCGSLCARCCAVAANACIQRVSSVEFWSPLLQ